jgi:hypothetical protein
VGIEALSHALDESLLSFGQESCHVGSSLQIDVNPHEFLLRPVSMSWASDDAAFERFVEGLRAGIDDSGIPADAVSLLIVATTPFLKTTAVVFEHRLSALETLDRTVVLTEPERPTPLRAPFNGFVTDTFLLLNRDLPPAPLRPHGLGTWLAHGRFRIETNLAPALLPPTPLTDELRQKLELQPKTIRYLDFGDHDVFDPYREQDQPTFYVDDQLLAQLNARKTSPSSKAIQMQLAYDFVAAVVRRASVEVERLRQVSYEDIHTSLLGSVVRLAAGAGSTEADRDRLIDRLDEDPEFVIARAEHFIGIGDGFGGALKELDT